MKKPVKRTTIHDVAKDARVSVATVSRALNDSPLVAEKTKQYVESIASRLHYVASASARSLSTRTTETIGVLLPDIYGEFFSELIRGADAVARKQNYHLIVSSSHSNKQELLNAIKLVSGRVDGLVVMSPHMDEDTSMSPFLNTLPTVVLSSSVAASSFDAIKIDNVGGGKQVTRHLIERGHKRIAIVKGDPGNADSEERYSGYTAALEEAGIPLTDGYVIQGDFTESSGYQAAAHLLALRQRPTAIFASNDEMAIGVLRCLRSQSVDVPKEIAVAGFDDIQISSLIHPSLTTVHVDISLLGSLALEKVLQRIRYGRQKREPANTVLPVHLIVRESTALSS